MLQIKALMRAHGLRHDELATAMGIARTTFGQICNHGHWPRSLDRAALVAKAKKFLKGSGVSGQALSTCFEEVPEPCTNTAQAGALVSASFEEKDDAMLLRKQGLAPAARKHFGLFKDPLADEMVCADDVFISPDIRYVRESMWQTARHGGFVAVVGESGSGKSTLRRDLLDRIVREGQRVIVIEPYVLGMEDTDTKGKTLKAGHIAEAILAAVAPLESVKSSPEARFRQVHRVLRDSRRGGNQHVLVIEEAHGLPIATLKHLKRFFELEDGFAKLLSIVLIGQSELRTKLSENDPNVREVVQRCEVIELAPLDGRLADYLRFKFERVGKPLAEVVDDKGLDALRARLTARVPSAQGAGARRAEHASVSLLYPLAVNNLLTACMNLAADLGVPVVTADVVREV